jgi:hypothetical protein
MKYFWLYHSPDSSASRVIRLTPVKKIVNIAFQATIVSFSLEITHFQQNVNDLTAKAFEKEELDHKSLLGFSYLAD